MTHPLGLLIFCAFVVFAIVIACWTFLPGMRAAMRGYSTVIEGAAAIALGIFGQFSGALQDAQAAGYIPPQIATYVPFVLLLWLIVKRFMTTTPVGSK